MLMDIRNDFIRVPLKKEYLIYLKLYLKSLNVKNV